MMGLFYRVERDAYDGERVSVPRWLFDEAVAELVEGGMTDAAARSRLLEECEWIDVEGTALLPLCLHCRSPLPLGWQFCNVLCQAAFIVDVHG